MNQTYAIVDIETTGTNPKMDRIIQFGCVLVENNEIVGRFSTDINPGQAISKQIQSLTQISNRQVKKAPFFEDVATTIYNLLEDTHFVAHNIHFDYHFLNQELIRCGLPALTIPGIDTVELAQIFLPTEASFRLNDLAESLGIEHENPHQAASDAEVTAMLLLEIERRARALPIATIQKIALLSSETSYQTSQYIQNLNNRMKQSPQKLPDNSMVVAGVVLKKKEIATYQAPLYAFEYPTTKKGKEQLFKEVLDYRRAQSKLMNLIHRHATTTDDKSILIEASTGTGKTIGYLLPASYLATPENPVIISTASILLQNQLLKKDIPQLNQLLDHSIQATVIKGKSHYIDLQRFHATLLEPMKQKQYRLYQMRILVWLTQTETGDFSELNLTSLNHLFFEEVKHRGLNYLTANQPFYQEDFLRHLQLKMQQSNFLIVNHAFLAQETQREELALPMSDLLIIDEAHHLPEIMEQVTNQFFDTESFQRKIRHLREENQLFDQVEEMFENDIDARHLLELYQEELLGIIDLQEEILAEVLIDQPVKQEIIIEEEQMRLSVRGERSCKKLFLYYEETLVIQNQIAKLCLQRKDQWLNREQIVYGELLALFESIEVQVKVVRQWLLNWGAQLIHKIYPYGNQQSGRLQIIDLSAAILPNTTWYERYKKVILVGGTLKVPSQANYFANRLGIPETPLKVIPSPFDYQNQARLLVLDEVIDIKEMSTFEYSKFIAKNLRSILEEIEHSTLVLFTSHEILQKVYHQLQMDFLENGREIMAQGIGGSREKLLKRFRHTKGAILFGADSFWEGVDLPGETLQLLIVTRLPFEHPDRPLIEAKARYAQIQGFNYFRQESLPKTALRLRQGLGRLIRSESDRGVMIVLDHRLVHASYGKQIQKSLPKHLPIAALPLQEIVQETRTFFEKNTTKQ
ncbi:helicase C-terminal domain-containing protein [Enterococcus sp.]|uniref:helicase C-terminal domain-containing protein n=1 Tax=Enterococcus sp. TaxID=35783 RepID=UPI002FCC70FA